MRHERNPHTVTILIYHASKVAQKERARPIRHANRVKPLSLHFEQQELLTSIWKQQQTSAQHARDNLCTNLQILPSRANQKSTQGPSRTECESAATQGSSQYDQKDDGARAVSRGPHEGLMRVHGHSQGALRRGWCRCMLAMEMVLR